VNNLVEDIYDTEEYRDSLVTIDSRGKRVWLYPKRPSGKWFNARTIVTIFYLILFFSLPFIKYQGDPILLFNVVEQKFILFGILFTPPDFYILAISMVTFIVFIALFTVVFGRLFCGWACPQTVFMEMVFRRIEYAIEGDAGAQRKLNASPMNSDKFTKKAIKHLIFFAIAVLVANFFLAYIIGIDQVKEIITEPVNNHLGGFIAMLVFSALFYGVFAFMREQVCTQVCPYGRMQSVLLNNDSVVVAYDHVRGEPRGKLQKSKASSPLSAIQESIATAAAIPSVGDCIDCKLCIHVCPTGIDIRNGTQLECVNCTACIDACNDIMDKVSKPRGLIRYDSLNGIKTGKRDIFSTRAKAYSVILVALASVSIYLIATRTMLDGTVFRSPGQTFQQISENKYSNLYTYQLLNKTRVDIPVEVKLISPAGGQLKTVGAPIVTAPSLKKAEGAFFIELDSKDMHGRKTEVVIQVLSEGKVVEEIKSNFIGPI
jgi:cytochrome c oxidase accessory protein FixG